MLFKANELSQALSHTLTAIMIGAGDEAFINDLTKRADRVIAVEDEQLRNFNADLYKEILHRLMEEHRPFLTLMGHTAWALLPPFP
jgi:electron transfer flavoprotein alpha subunit